LGTIVHEIVAATSASASVTAAPTDCRDHAAVQQLVSAA